MVVFKFFGKIYILQMLIEYGMETVTIPKEEYEKLKKQAIKMKIIDETIHEELSSKELMKLQEKQKSFEFLSDKREDIYTPDDLK